MEIKKSGMKKGFLQYESYKDLFVNSLIGSMNTKSVMIAFNEHLPYGMKLSWNTVQKYLRLLETEGKIKHEILGGKLRKIHIWSKLV